MKKIASNVLIVSTQLIVGGLFLFMLFSNKGNTQDVVVKNTNLDRMADSVSELFVADKLEKKILDEKKEEELLAQEELAKKKALEEEQKRIAEEEARKAKEEEERRLAEEAEAQRKAQEEAQRRAQAVMSSDQSVAALQSYAHDLVVNAYGWSEEDFVALVNLWNKESGWNIRCYNSSSGAYGIPQSLPGNKMASEGADWEYNGETQIRWGLKYIQGRYGSPSGAWGHFLSHNWY